MITQKTKTKNYQLLLFLVMLLTGIFLSGSNARAEAQQFTDNGILYEKREDGMIVDVEQGLSFSYDTKTKSYIVEDYFNIGKNRSVIIPDTIQGKKVTELSASAFGRNANIKSVKVGKNIKKIGASCFLYCTGLTEMTIPKNVKEIGQSAFQECKNLKKVVIKGNSPRAIYTFANCEKLEEIVISGNIDLIGSGFVKGCKSLKKIRITGEIGKVFDGAFEDAGKFTWIAPKGSKAYALCYEAKFANLATTDDLQFNIKTGLMVAGESKQISAINYDGNLTWKSSNKSVIKITKDGMATAVKAGTATLTATGKDQKFTFKMKVLSRTYNNVMKVITTEYVRPEMTDYEKVVEANAWLIRNIKYNYDAYLDNSYGLEDAQAETVLVRGLAVCAGYTDSFMKIMEYYNIPCKSNISWVMNHAWNVVKIDKHWYHVDVTWNDPIITTADGKKINTNTQVKSDYLLLSDDELIGRSGYNIKCTTSSHDKVNKKYRTVSANSKKKIKDTALQPYLNKTKVTLAKGGDTFTLKLTGAKVKAFSVKNKKIATVSKKGVITAKKKGSTTVQVKTTKGKTYSCTVKVEDPAINKKELSLVKGDTADLEITGTTESITWKSSDKKVATITAKGKVKAVGDGTAQITTTVRGRKFTCTVTVHEHSYTETVTKKVTCEGAGVKTFTCSCGKSYAEEIPAIGHSYKEEITKEANCEETGVKTFTCSCGKSYTEEIPALGHDYQWVITKNPSGAIPETIEDFGTRAFQCTHCKDTQESELVIEIDGKQVYGYFDDALAADFGENINAYRQNGIKAPVPELSISTSLDHIAKIELAKYLCSENSEPIKNYPGVIAEQNYTNMWEEIGYIAQTDRVNRANLIRDDITTMGTAAFRQRIGKNHYWTYLIVLME